MFTKSDLASNADVSVAIRNNMERKSNNGLHIIDNSYNSKHLFEDEIIINVCNVFTISFSAFFYSLDVFSLHL